MKRTCISSIAKLKPHYFEEMRGMDTVKFFKVKKASDVKWIHRANDKKRLLNSVKSDCMMVEGDVSISENGNIIMAHPPQQESDLTFEEWLEYLLEFRKGAKIDFKDPQIVKPVLEKLKSSEGKIPIFLNADVLQGPGGIPPLFDGVKFVEECNELFPKADYISLGWTTGYTLFGRYTEKMVKEMIALSHISKIPVTVSVLLYYLPRSWKNLKRILEETNDTFTIWNIKKLGVSRNLQRWLIRNIIPEKTFIDLMDKKGSAMKVELEGK